MDRPFHVLFLCTGNSARSVIAEALLARLGAGRFRASSAGSHPAGRLNPIVVEMLEEKGFSTEGLRSKSWDEFAAADASPIDAVITVCDAAASEACPVLPGRPAVAHWGLEDPAAFMDDPAQARRVAESAFRILEERIRRMVESPPATPPDRDP